MHEFTKLCSQTTDPTPHLYISFAQITPLQKVQQVLLWFPATIPAPYELPESGLSENVKIKKIYRGTLASEFSKPVFY